MVFSILTRKSQVPRLRSQLCPSEAQVLAKRRQVSTGGSHRARPPDPAQRSSLMQPSTQAPAGLQSPQAAHTVESGPARCSPGRRPLPSGHRGRDGERSTAAWRQSWARPVGSIGKGSGAPQNTAPPVPPAWGRASWRLGGAGQDPPLLSSPDNHHSDDHWLNDPLTFAHWQLVIWRRGSLWHYQWLSRVTNSLMHGQSVTWWVGPRQPRPVAEEDH